MKVHLRILYGIDDKFDIVDNTLRVCKDYFDSIKVVNSGPDKLMDQFSSHTLVEFETMGMFSGDQEPYRRSFYYGIDKNDWVLWLDSDERPTQELLDNLDLILVGCESGNYFNCKIPYYSHNWYEIENSGEFSIDKYWLKPDREWPMIKEDIGRIPIPPPIHDRFFKYTDKTCITTNFGGHGYIIGNKETANSFDNPHWHYSPYALNHYKDGRGEHQSFILHNFTTPCRNTSYKDSVKIVMNSPQYKLIQEFQIKEKVFTSNDLVYKVKTDDAFKERFARLYNDPLLEEDIDSVRFSLYKAWANKYKMSFENNIFRCEDKCCKYDSVQL